MLTRAILQNLNETRVGTWEFYRSQRYLQLICNINLTCRRREYFGIRKNFKGDTVKYQPYSISTSWIWIYIVPDFYQRVNQGGKNVKSL